MRTMPAELQAKLPHSTNAAESGHWLYTAPLGLGSKPQAKSRIKWHENDGRAPDTRERLAAVEKLEADAPPHRVRQRPTFDASILRVELQLMLIDAPMEAYFPAFVVMGDAGYDMWRTFMAAWTSQWYDCGRAELRTQGAPKPDKKKLMDALRLRGKPPKPTSQTEIQTELGIHFDDLRLAQHFINAELGAPLLDDFLMHAIPSGANSGIAGYYTPAVA
ncbi:hypothetical protein K438DRAFT_2004379 [Mycena galopus ATCC 62051]|nr:hypothetical protein K438DRAFT_2004379 [Mycena galopus ATCC 62051]